MKQFQMGDLVVIVNETTRPEHGQRIGTRAMIVKLRDLGSRQWYIRTLRTATNGVDSDQYFAVEEDLRLVDEDDDTEHLDVEARKLLGVTHCPHCGRKYDHVPENRPEQPA